MQPDDVVVGMWILAVPGPMSRIAARVLGAATASAVAASMLGGCASHRVQGVLPDSQPTEWSSVTRLGPGALVRIEDAAHNVVAGRFVRADHCGVTLANEVSSQTVLQSDVERVTLISRLTASKAKRGGIAGTVAGGLAGTLTVKSNRVPWGLLLAAGWGAVGALIGASDGFADRKETVVYQAARAAPVPPVDEAATARRRSQAATLCVSEVADRAASRCGER